MLWFADSLLLAAILNLAKQNQIVDQVKDHQVALRCTFYLILS